MVKMDRCSVYQNGTPAFGHQDGVSSSCDGHIDPFTFSGYCEAPDALEGSSSGPTTIASMAMNAEEKRRRGIAFEASVGSTYSTSSSIVGAVSKDAFYDVVVPTSAGDACVDGNSASMRQAAENATRPTPPTAAAHCRETHYVGAMCGAATIPRKVDCRGVDMNVVCGPDVSHRGVALSQSSHNVDIQKDWESMQLQQQQQREDEQELVEEEGHNSLHSNKRRRVLLSDGMSQCTSDMNMQQWASCRKGSTNSKDTGGSSTMTATYPDDETLNAALFVQQTRCLLSTAFCRDFTAKEVKTSLTEVVKLFADRKHERKRSVVSTTTSQHKVARGLSESNILSKGGAETLDSQQSGLQHTQKKQQQQREKQQGQEQPEEQQHVQHKQRYLQSQGVQRNHHWQQQQTEQQEPLEQQMMPQTLSPDVEESLEKEIWNTIQRDAMCAELNNEAAAAATGQEAVTQKMSGGLISEGSAAATTALEAAVEKVFERADNEEAASAAAQEAVTEKVTDKVSYRPYNEKEPVAAPATAQEAVAEKVSNRPYNEEAAVAPAAAAEAKERTVEEISRGVSNKEPGATEAAANGEDMMESEDERQQETKLLFETQRGGLFFLFHLCIFALPRNIPSRVLALNLLKKHSSLSPYTNDEELVTLQATACSKKDGTSFHRIAEAASTCPGSRLQGKQSWKGRFCSDTRGGWSGHNNTTSVPTASTSSIENGNRDREYSSTDINLHTDNKRSSSHADNNNSSSNTDSKSSGSDGDSSDSSDISRSSSSFANSMGGTTSNSGILSSGSNRRSPSLTFPLETLGRVAFAVHLTNKQYREDYGSDVVHEKTAANQQQQHQYREGRAPQGAGGQQQTGVTAADFVEEQDEATVTKFAAEQQQLPVSGLLRGRYMAAAAATEKHFQTLLGRICRRRDHIILCPYIIQALKAAYRSDMAARNFLLFYMDMQRRAERTRGIDTKMEEERQADILRQIPTHVPAAVSNTRESDDASVNATAFDSQCKADSRDETEPKEGAASCPRMGRSCQFHNDALPLTTAVASAEIPGSSESSIDLYAANALDARCKPSQISPVDAFLSASVHTKQRAAAAAAFFTRDCEDPRAAVSTAARGSVSKSFSKAPMVAVCKQHLGYVAAPTNSLQRQRDTSALAHSADALLCSEDSRCSETVMQQNSDDVWQVLLRGVVAVEPTATAVAGALDELHSGPASPAVPSNVAAASALAEGLSAVSLSHLQQEKQIKRRRHQGERWTGLPSFSQQHPQATSTPEDGALAIRQIRAAARQAGAALMSLDHPKNNERLQPVYSVFLKAIFSLFPGQTVHVEGIDLLAATLTTACCSPEGLHMLQRPSHESRGTQSSTRTSTPLMQCAAVRHPKRLTGIAEPVKGLASLCAQPLVHCLATLHVPDGDLNWRTPRMRSALLQLLQEMCLTVGLFVDGSLLLLTAYAFCLLNAHGLSGLSCKRGYSSCYSRRQETENHLQRLRNRLKLAAAADSVQRQNRQQQQQRVRLLQRLKRQQQPYKRKRRGSTTSLSHEDAPEALDLLRTTSDRDFNDGSTICSQQHASDVQTAHLLLPVYGPLVAYLIVLSLRRVQLESRSPPSLTRGKGATASCAVFDEDEDFLQVAGNCSSSPRLRSECSSSSSRSSFCDAAAAWSCTYQVLDCISPTAAGAADSAFLARGAAAAEGLAAQLAAMLWRRQNLRFLKEPPRWGSVAEKAVMSVSSQTPVPSAGEAFVRGKMLQPETAEDLRTLRECKNPLFTLDACGIILMFTIEAFFSGHQVRLLNPRCITGLRFIYIWKLLDLYINRCSYLHSKTMPTISAPGSYNKDGKQLIITVEPAPPRDEADPLLAMLSTRGLWHPSYLLKMWCSDEEKIAFDRLTDPLQKVCCSASSPVDFQQRLHLPQPTVTTAPACAFTGVSLIPS